MRVRKFAHLSLLCLTALIFLAAPGRAQSHDSTKSSDEITTQPTHQSPNPFRGFIGYEYLSITSDTFGQLFRLDSNLGYSFNRYFGFDIGIPLYLANGSPSVGTSGSGLMPANRGGTSLNSASGSGDVYADLLFTVPVRVINWYSTLTGTLPTGKVSAGFSTGRATFDWDNYLEHDFSHLRPFADVGLADSIYDTGAFVLPYTTFGLVTHLEGGAGYQVVRPISIGASIYDDVTSGQQTVFSRVLPHAFRGSGPCLAASAFECANQTMGPAAIARDHGVTVWIQSSSFHGLDLFGGYTYSAQYKLNTFSLGVGLRLGPLFQRARSTFDKPKRQP
ncbi:MAG: hypothetical protein ACRD3T_15290 [Terriglobia bacterium]